MQSQPNFVGLSDKRIALNMLVDNHSPIVTQLLNSQRFVSM